MFEHGSVGLGHRCVGALLCKAVGCWHDWAIYCNWSICHCLQHAYRDQDFPHLGIVKEKWHPLTSGKLILQQKRHVIHVIIQAA